MKKFSALKIVLVNLCPRISIEVYKTCAAMNNLIKSLRIKLFIQLQSDFYPLTIVKAISLSYRMSLHNKKVVNDKMLGFVIIQSTFYKTISGALKSSILVEIMNDMYRNHFTSSHFTRKSDLNFC